MIRTRLAIAFSLLALLALGQCLYAWWAASLAAHHAQSSVLAARLQAEYLEISADKQRLKVWFAQRMLAGDADPAERDRLLARMRASLATLGELLPGLPAGASRQVEDEAFRLVTLNIDTLAAALQRAEQSDAAPNPATQWREVLLAFDELSGQDMRGLLRDAVDRHETAAARGSGQLSAALAEVRQSDAVLAVLVVLLAIAAVVWFVRMLDRPVAALARLAESLGRGDFSARSGLAGVDEFSRIGNLLDSMAATLAEARTRSADLQQRLEALVSERTRAVTQAYEALTGMESRRRQFFAELSHELRTPVTVVRGEAEIALRGAADPASLREALTRIVAAADELGSRVRELLDAARSGAEQYALARRPGALVAIVADAVRQMQAVAQHRGVLMDFRPPVKDSVVLVDRERLQQALVIVLDNALRYSPAGGRVEVRVTADSELVMIVVEDEGVGMAPAELEQAFEPRFRGRDAQVLDPDGCGLGLSIAERILIAHGGSIELASRQPRGLRSTLLLSLPQPVSEAA
jgi:two-component system OmpR family sensor kinase